MQISAKLIQLLPLQTGTSKNGEWKKQDVILETEGTYPKKICVSFWGDKIDEKALQPGAMLKIDFDIESREYNGKWYTDLKAWKSEVLEPALIEMQTRPSTNTPSIENIPDEVLPF